LSVLDGWLFGMTVQPIRRYDDHRVVDALRIAQRALLGAGEIPCSRIGDDELADAISEVAVLESQAAALKLRLLAEADQRKVAKQLGATGTDAWAAALTGTTRGVVAGGIWLARRLEETYHATREAFADGGINEAQARVIVKAAETLPKEVSDEERRAAEEALVVKAVNGMNAKQLRQAARRMAEVISREVADRHEADLLDREQRRAEAETYLALHDNGDGTFSGKFTIPELHGQMLRTVLEQLTSPRRLARDKDGRPVVDESVPDPGLNWYERMGLAFTEVIEHLPTKGFGSNLASVLVHLDYQHLLDGLASARLDTGVHTSAGEARRLACGAGIIPAVLGSRSEPLDVGRKSRLHTEPQRAALSIRYKTCATVGCERPFAWCDVHHPHAWSAGGETSLDNALPLCGFHHRRAHDSRFDMRCLASGEVRFRRRR
jgi:hypothetical protein